MSQQQVRTEDLWVRRRLCPRRASKRRTKDVGSEPRDVYEIKVFEAGEVSKSAGIAESEAGFCVHEPRSKLLPKCACMGSTQEGALTMQYSNCRPTTWAPRALILLSSPLGLRATHAKPGMQIRASSSISSFGGVGQRLRFSRTP